MQIVAKKSPTIFGPFEVISLIGRGASATVYKVRHRPSGKIAALKVSPRFLRLDHAAFERFRREFTVLRPLQHANVVRPIAMGGEDDVPFLVLEYVAGQNLEQRIKQHGPLPAEQAAAIFTQVAEGLGYLHVHQLLHRDIKPSNIFVTPANQAKLGDFGLLKNLDGELALTQSRQSMGTMEYGAPEQFEDAKRVDRRCDLYSLAATLYTTLTGKFPFGRGGHMQVLQRKILNQFVPLRLVLPTLNPALDDLVTRCLHPVPEQRPNDCGEWLAVLRSSKGTAAATQRTGEKDGHAVKPSGRERRATIRMDVELTANFVPFDQKIRGRWDATILNISPSGVRLETPQPVAVNSVLHLTLGRCPTPHLVLVHWVKQGKAQNYVAGCSFVRPLERAALAAICPHATEITASRE